jgi:hypothetical protein
MQVPHHPALRITNDCPGAEEPLSIVVWQTSNREPRDRASPSALCNWLQSRELLRRSHVHLDRSTLGRADSSRQQIYFWAKLNCSFLEHGLRLGLPKVMGAERRSPSFFILRASEIPMSQHAQDQTAMTPRRVSSFPLSGRVSLRRERRCFSQTADFGIQRLVQPARLGHRFGKGGKRGSVIGGRR